MATPKSPKLSLLPSAEPEPKQFWMTGIWTRAENF